MVRAWINVPVGTFPPQSSFVKKVLVSYGVAAPKNITSAMPQRAHRDRADLARRLAERDAQMAKRDDLARQLAERDAQLAERDDLARQLAERDAQLAKRDAELASLRAQVAGASGPPAHRQVSSTCGRAAHTCFHCQ